MIPGDIIKFNETNYHRIVSEDGGWYLVQSGEIGILIEIQRTRCKVLQGGKFLFVDSLCLSLG